jgi:ribose-phosphate pyrophosphokinase
MSPLLVESPQSGSFGRRLAEQLGIERLRLEYREFPDSETYLRLERPCAGRDVIVAASLDGPNSKILPLLFLTDLLRELGAGQVVLIAPYLPYMRQDARFAPGEAVTSRSFARLLSSAVDRLVTVDPHLHRFDDLAELYAIPAMALHAAPLLAGWIKTAVERPLVVGPDAESAQGAAEVAELAGAPSLVLEKTRRGDRDVEVAVPSVDHWREYRPVLVDDIISTARTMIETTRQLRRHGLAAPVCVGVHAVFAGDAYNALRAAGVERIVTTNTIVHPSNAIDVTDLIAKATASLSTG